MNVRAWIPAAILLTLVTATTAGWIWTREFPVQPEQEGTANPGPPSKDQRGLHRPPPVKERLVDQTPLFTARGLMPLAATVEEQQLAHQAERLANHEVDLAFADALRRASTSEAPQTPEVKALAALKEKAEAQVETDQKLIARLTGQLAGAPAARKDSLEDQLEVVKAQLELDQDDLESASDELARAGGDPQARIRRLKEAHEAADRESSQMMSGSRSATIFQQGSLVARIAEWRAQKSKEARLGQAKQGALAKAQFLATLRVKIEARIKKEKDEREAAKAWASTLVKGPARHSSGPDRETAKDAASSLRQYADVQRRLADMGRRIQDQQGLAETYGNWLVLVDGYRNAALHQVLARLLWVLGLVLVTVLAGWAIDHGYHRATSGDRKSLGTTRTVVKVLVRVLAVLVIGFLVLGMPAQPTTVFGLAGAGLTVALKDFIVAFFGWFILMGRNGIRVGDWVEIRGVGGEVVEIGLLRTVVLETGSWNDAGHPTGRRVAFVNNFAIEGHFFNFSTSGKWMWDELQILVPLGQDPYVVIDGVQRLVEQQTAANAKLAEAEWQQVAARYRIKAFTAVPGVQVVPGASGMEVRARYITRAFERHETRLRLNQAVVELMHGPRMAGGGAVVKVEA
jgi:small-conductance mechanosensitive channel